MADNPLDSFIVNKYDAVPAAGTQAQAATPASSANAAPNPTVSGNSVGTSAPQPDPLAAYTVSNFDAAPAAAAQSVDPNLSKYAVPALSQNNVPTGYDSVIPTADRGLIPYNSKTGAMMTPQLAEIDVNGAAPAQAPAPAPAPLAAVAVAGNDPLLSSLLQTGSTPAYVPPAPAAQAAPSSPSASGQPVPTGNIAAQSAQPPVSAPAQQPVTAQPATVQAPAMPSQAPPSQPQPAFAHPLQAAPQQPQLDSSQQGQATVGNVARAVGDGLLLGFGDELTAGVRSLMGEPYAAALQDERQKLAAYQTAHPGQAMTAEIVGGIAPLALSFVAPEMAPATISRLVPASARTALAPIVSKLMAPAAQLATPNTIGRAALAGASTGAVSGFGHGEGGLGNRFTSAVEGAPVGAAFGVGGAAIGSALGRVMAPDDGAIGLWARQLHAGGTSADSVNYAALQAKAAIPPPGARATPSPLTPPQLTTGETLGDPATHGLMDSLTNRPGVGMKMAASIAKERQGRNDIQDALTGVFGDKQSAIENQMRLYTERSAQARGDYDAALTGVNTASDKDEIGKILKNVPSRYLSEGRELATTRDDAYNIHVATDKDGNVVKTKVPSARYIHGTLSSLKAASRDRQSHFPGAPRTADAAAALELSRPIQAYLDKVTGGRYAEASHNFAIHSRRIEANDAGIKAMLPSTRHEHITRDLQDKYTSEDDRGAYATGVLQSIRDRMRIMGTTGNAAERVFGKEFQSENLRAAMRSVHENPENADAAYDRLAAFLEAKNNAYRTAQGWVGNSRTAVRTAVGKDIDEQAKKGLLRKIGHGMHHFGGHGAGPLVALEMAEHMGLPGHAALAAVPLYMGVTKAGAMLEHMAEHRAQHNGALARLLFSRDPKKIASMLETLHAHMENKPHGAAGALRVAAGRAGSLIGGLAAGGGK